MYLASGTMWRTPAPLAPMAANTTSLATAMKQNTLGVGYAGAGFLLFYYIGVSKVLQQLGVIKPGVTKTAASSAGILSACVDYGFVSHEQFIHVGKDFAARCRANHNCAGSLAAEVTRAAELVTPADAAKKLSGIGYIAMSSPNLLGVPVGHYVVNYTSREDVVSAVNAGVYLPLWSGINITTTFRGEKRYDGAFRTPLPCPKGNTTYCLKVNVLPPWTMAEVMEDLKNPGVWPYLLQAFNSTFFPNPVSWTIKEEIEQLQHPFERFDEVLTGWKSFMTNQPPSSIVDIWPGKYNKNPHSLVRWMLMILRPPTDADVDTMVTMGVRDAYSWAKEQGLIPPGLSY